MLSSDNYQGNTKYYKKGIVATLLVGMIGSLALVGNYNNTSSEFPDEFQNLTNRR